MLPLRSKCSLCHHSTCCRELKIKMRMLPWRPASSGWLWQNSQCARKCCADISPSKWTHTHTHTHIGMYQAHAHTCIKSPVLTLGAVDSWKPWQQIGEDLALEMIVFLTSELLIKKPWPLTSAGAAICHRAVTLSQDPQQESHVMDGVQPMAYPCPLFSLFPLWLPVQAHAGACQRDEVLRNRHHSAQGQFMCHNICTCGGVRHWINHDSGQLKSINVSVQVYWRFIGVLFWTFYHFIYRQYSVSLHELEITEKKMFFARLL